jgi:hypothetical protein
MDFVMAMHVLLLTNTNGVFLTEGFRLEEYFLVFTRQCVRTHRIASRIGVLHMQVWQILHEEDLYPYHDQRVQHLEPGDHAQRMDTSRTVKRHFIH